MKTRAKLEVMSIKKISLALTTAVILALVTTPHVNAHTDGFWLGKWPNTPRTLKWNYLGGHKYLGNVWQGAANWNDSISTITLSQVTSGSFHIEVYDATLPNETYWAQAWTDTSPQAASYSYGRIKYNESTMDQTSDFTRTKVATHEFGHIFGLSHVPASYGNNAIMKTGVQAYNDVQYHDWQDFAAKY